MVSFNLQNLPDLCYFDTRIISSLFQYQFHWKQARKYMPVYKTRIRVREKSFTERFLTDTDASIDVSQYFHNVLFFWRTRTLTRTRTRIMHHGDMDGQLYPLLVNHYAVSYSTGAKHIPKVMICRVFDFNVITQDQWRRISVDFAETKYHPTTATASDASSVSFDITVR